MTDFNFQRYQEEPGGLNAADDNLGNLGYTIDITHVPSGTTIKFKAFITAFTDTYSQDWGGEKVYGRADPLYNFRNTTRKISLSFVAPANSEGEAYENLGKAQKLAQFMYPNYTTVTGSAKVISQGPLLRLKVMNMMRDTSDNTSPGDTAETELYSSYNKEGNGLLGFCDSVTFQFGMDSGDLGVFQRPNGVVLPKIVEVNIGGFSPIHEHHLGWDENNLFSEQISFPYGASTPISNTSEEVSALETGAENEIQETNNEADSQEAIATVTTRSNNV